MYEIVTSFDRSSERLTVPDVDSQPGLIAYGDYCCPFSYLLWHSLGEYWRTAHDPPAVSWRPFDVHYNRRNDDGSLSKPAVNTFYERIAPTATETAASRGIELDLNAARGVDGQTAHSVSLVVRDEAGPSAADHFHELVFQAVWEQRRDISDPDVLTELAEEAGVLPSTLDDAMASGQYRQKRLDLYEQARSQGVTATPTLTFGEETREGALTADEIESFVG